MALNNTTFYSEALLRVGCGGSGGVQSLLNRSTDRVFCNSLRTASKRKDGIVFGCVLASAELKLKKRSILLN